jgi:DNA-binding PadR family transcriptional regulator
MRSGDAIDARIGRLERTGMPGGASRVASGAADGSAVPINLTPTSYVVLGMVALRGSSTPYDLKRAVARSVGHFWSFPHSQLYAEPARLAAAGLLSEERQQGGRNRRVYSITAAGQAAVRAWLATPSQELYELRDLAQLQLFFSELSSRETVVALAAAQVQLHQQRLAEYEALAVQFADRLDVSYRLAPLRFGLAFERAQVQFWTEIAAHPPADERQQAT